MRTFTLEALINGNAFKNQISTIMGIEGKFLVRIGDSGVGSQSDSDRFVRRNLTNSDLKLDAGRWYQVAVTFESGNVKVYLDGAEKCSGNVGTSSVNFGVAHSDESDGKPRCFWIGYSYASDRYFDGPDLGSAYLEQGADPRGDQCPRPFLPGGRRFRPDWWPTGNSTKSPGKTIKDQTSYGNDLTVEKEWKWVNVSLPELGK